MNGNLVRGMPGIPLIMGWPKFRIKKRAGIRADRDVQDQQLACQEMTSKG